jgi:putative ABC transport system substrate-binding protein
MRRRDFIIWTGCAAAWPFALRAQQRDQMRRIGVLMNVAANDPEGQVRLAAFVKGLRLLGWAAGRNLQIDTRWAAADVDLFRRYATELVSAAPDVILASTNLAVAPLRRATRTVPIVFVLTIDPVGAGDVASLARPGGNATGFLLFEYSISGKWFEILRQIVPGVRRVVVLRDPTTAAGIGQFAAIQAAAVPSGVELSPVDVRDVSEIERAIVALNRESNGGLIVTASNSAALHSEMIIMLAARHRLPTVSSGRRFAIGGGLISYAPDFIDQYQRAAAYIDRILRGESPANLPVQAPTKYEMVINLRTAKALGLTMPPQLLTQANEVIE